MREENIVYNPCHQRSCKNHKQQIRRAVLFFEKRPYDQKQHNISNKMLPVCVAKHMPDHPHIRQRRQQRGMIDTKKCVCRPSLGKPA